MRTQSHQRPYPVEFPQFFPQLLKTLGRDQRCEVLGESELTPKGADEAADCSTLVSLIDTPRICSLTLEVRSIYRLPHRATASVLRPGLRRDHGQGCAHVSAKFPSSRQGARLFGSYGNEEWPTGAEAPSSEGSQAAHREQRVAISPQCVPEVLGVRSDRHARFRP